MTLMTTRTRLLLDDFLALPDEKPYLELIDGEVCQKPVGKKKHSRAARRIARMLEDHPATRDGEVLPELGMHWWGQARSDHRVPDVSYYARGRVVADPYPLEPPDLVIEVRSEGQSREGIDSRLAFLRSQGVPCTLHIDPEDETVTATEDGNSSTLRGQDQVTLRSLGGFSFRPADLFA